MMTLSIFGTDLANPPRRSLLHDGAIFSCEAIALASDLARHFNIGFDEVEAVLSPVLPHSIPSLRTPDGWALFGQYISNHLSSPHRAYRPVLH